MLSLFLISTSNLSISKDFIDFINSLQITKQIYIYSIYYKNINCQLIWHDYCLYKNKKLKL